MSFCIVVYGCVRACVRVCVCVHVHACPHMITQNVINLGTSNLNSLHFIKIAHTTSIYIGHFRVKIKIKVSLNVFHIYGNTKYQVL